MLDIYGNSYVTLAAVWGHGSESGLFSTGEDFQSVLLADLYLNNHHWPLYMQQNHHQYFTWSGDKREPLFTRAWAYQERLIAPRVLYFRKDELSFECFCDAACECGLTQHHASGPQPSFHKKLFFEDVVKFKEGSISPGSQDSQHSHESRSDYEDSDAPEQQWRATVQNYSGLKLKEKDDKLTAIRAVADQFRTARPKEEYLFGLWSGSLLRDLLWHTMDRGHSPVQRVADVPTWSWASISNRHIVYPYVTSVGFVATAEVVDSTINNSLKLRGRLLPCWLIRNVDAIGYKGRYLSLNRHFKFGISRGRVYLDDATALLGEKLLQKVYLFEVARCNSISQRDFYFLILCRNSDYSSCDPDGKAPHAFSRVGYFVLSHMDDRSGWGWHKLRSNFIKVLLKIFGTVERINLY